MVSSEKKMRTHSQTLAGGRRGTSMLRHQDADFTFALLVGQLQTDHTASRTSFIQSKIV
jgi:hypothetical protein